MKKLWESPILEHLHLDFSFLWGSKGHGNSDHGNGHGHWNDWLHWGDNDDCNDGSDNDSIFDS